MMHDLIELELIIITILETCILIITVLETCVLIITSPRIITVLETCVLIITPPETYNLQSKSLCHNYVPYFDQNHT